MRFLSTLPLPDSAIEALNKCGFITCEDIFADEQINPEAQEIILSTGGSLSAVMSALSPPKVLSASCLLKLETQVESIPTFSECLDNILGNSVAVGSILQVCGGPGSGKTQLCFQLCIDVQIPALLGGLNSEAVFIDTESSFSPSRLKEMAEATTLFCSTISPNSSDMNASSMLRGIYCQSVNNFRQLLACIFLLSDFVKTHPKVRLVVIDSFTLPFLNHPNLMERTRTIAHALNHLHLLAKKFSLAVVLTNHLTTRLQGNEVVLKPSLGDTLSHRVAQTLYLGRTGDVFSAFLYKSHWRPENVANFKRVHGTCHQVLRNWLSVIHVPNALSSILTRFASTVEATGRRSGSSSELLLHTARVNKRTVPAKPTLRADLKPSQTKVPRKSWLLFLSSVASILLMVSPAVANNHEEDTGPRSHKAKANDTATVPVISVSL